MPGGRTFSCNAQSFPLLVPKNEKNVQVQKGQLKKLDQVKFDKFKSSQDNVKSSQRQLKTRPFKAEKYGCTAVAYVYLWPTALA